MEVGNLELFKLAPLNGILLGIASVHATIWKALQLIKPRQVFGILLTGW